MCGVVYNLKGRGLTLPFLYKNANVTFIFVIKSNKSQIDPPNDEVERGFLMIKSNRRFFTKGSVS